MNSSLSRRRGRHGGGSLAALLVALLVAAPPALATDMRYQVPSSPAYDSDRADDTLNVTYEACIPAGGAQTLQLQVRSTNFSDTGPANFEVTTEEGQPAVTITPATVQLGADSEQEFEVTVTFSAPVAPTAFRIRLVPASGEAVEDGAGGMRVRLGCVNPTPPVTVSSPASPSAVAPCPPARMRVRAPRLRAGERAIIRVSVPNRPGTAEKGCVVWAKGPGVSVKGVTSEGGNVILRVRPTRRGTVLVRSNRLQGSRRLRVFPRRTATGRGSPRFTG